MQTVRLNRLTWPPSLDPTVQGYHLYRDGVLIATIPSGYGPFSYDDPVNYKERAPITYTLTAFNKNGEESPAQSVTLP
jgi:hypothetical protein